MSQLSLFDAPAKKKRTRKAVATVTPIARATDPSTSHDAAVGITPKLGGLKSRVLDVADSTPRTAREIAELCVGDLWR